MAAPVQAGITYTVADVKLTAGQIARRMRDTLTQADQFRKFLAATPDADLITFGLTQTEIDVIKGCYVAELAAMKTTFDGLPWTPRLLGLGV